MQQRPSFESLFRLSPNAYVLLDRDLVILDANAAYLALTGRRLEEIQGQRLHEAFAADPLSPETTRVQELLDSFARVLSRKAVDTLPVIRYSIARHTPLGPVYEDRYWSATHTPILDEQGEVVAILQHTSDITELQAMKDSLKQVAGHQPVQQLEQGVMSRARLLQSEGEQVRRLFAHRPIPIGAPNRSSMRLRRCGSNCPTGCASPVPIRATGTMGAFARSAIWATPG